MGEMDGAGNKTICTICFEELKPIVEDLQAVSICGHVFHEICLQQWFEYCTSSRKQSCPVCKQSCSGNKVCRLYFQSTGDISDAVATQRQNGCEENPEVLRKEVLRLEAKVLGLNSVLERQGKDLKDLNQELSHCKELVKKETTSKDDAVKQRITLQQLLHLKSQELDKSNLECSRLHDRNMALAKELAALKLVSDLELEEDEVLKFASLGNESNTRDTIDILRKSLVIRNKNYKELMAKCNVLGRGEARYSKKLEKAKEKISKLKSRIQELETSIETKDNELLRALKDSKKKSSKRPVESNVKSPSAKRLHVEDHLVKLSAPSSNLEVGIPTKASHRSLDMEDRKSKKDSDFDRPSASGAPYMSEPPFILIDEDASELPAADQSVPNFDLCNQRSETASMKDRGALLLGQDNPSSVNRKATCNDLSTTQPEISGVRTCIDLTGRNSTAVNDDGIGGATATARPVLTIRKETPSEVPLLRPGDACFSSGLLGPDGRSRYLGKWCKRGETKALNTAQNASSGKLIAVGSDGRGGRIKVLRSPLPSFMDDKENLVKKSRNGFKTTGSQSRGCLQMEHFFQKAHPN